MEQIKDILRESINSMQLWLNVYQVRPLNNGLQRLYVDRTWQLNNNMAVVLGMQKVRVKAFEVNKYIDVEAAELISTGKYLLPVPYFTNGKYKAVLDEVSRKMNKEDITPFFWLFENLQRTVPLSPTSAIDSEGEVRLFMLMASEFGKFTVEDHYTQAIEPIAKNLFAELIRQLSKHRLINSLTTSRITNHAKFTTGGNSIEDDGKAVFNLQLSGIEAYINLQVRKDQECSLPRKYDILVVSNIENGNEIEAVINAAPTFISVIAEIENGNEIETLIDITGDVQILAEVENFNAIEAGINIEAAPISLSVEVENFNIIESDITVETEAVSLSVEVENFNVIESDITVEAQAVSLSVEVENFNVIESDITVEAAPISLSVEVENFNIIESDITVEVEPISLSVEVENFNIIESDIEVEASAVPTITDVEFDGVPFEINQGETVIGVEIFGTDFTAITNDNQVDFGAGLTVDNVTVVDPTLITCNVTADIDATLGSQTLEITFDDSSFADFNNAVEILMTIQAINTIANHNTLTGASMATAQQLAVNGLWQRYRGYNTPNNSNLLALFDSTKHCELPFIPIDNSTTSIAAYRLNLHNAAKPCDLFGFVSGDVGTLITPSFIKGATGKYIRTSYNQLNDVGSLNYGMGSYLRQQNTSAQAECGANQSSSPFNGAILYPHSVGNDASFSGVFVSTTIQNPRTGLMTVQLSGGTQTKRRNGVTYNTRANAGTAQNLEIYALARNVGGNVSDVSTKETASSHPSLPPMTDAQAEDHYAAWQWFHQNIITGGRHV